MPAKTKIEWADYISNPIKARGNDKQGHACVKVSEGCAHCWASTFNVRLGTGMEYTLPNMQYVNLYLDEQELMRISTFKPRGPFKNKRDRALVFLFDMTDVFGDWVEDDWIEQCFSMFMARDDVDFLILTKRPDRMLKFCMDWEETYRKALPNVYMGVSVENERRSLERVESMRQVSKFGWKTVVSYEPALSSVTWLHWEFIDGLICGGESGPRARPMASQWAREAANFCQELGIPYFFKQWGEWVPVGQLAWMTDKTTFAQRPIEFQGEMMVRLGKGNAGHLLDGKERREMPR